MQQTASLPADSFTDLLAGLPKGLDLDALAVQTKAIQRRRRVGDGATVLRLALARGPGGQSLNQTAAWASMLGLAQLSDPGLKYRLDQAGDFLQAIMEHQIADHAGSVDLHWPGRTLRVVDGSYIKQRASKGVDWCVHATYDIGGGRFSHLELTDKHGAERLTRSAAVPGEVRIADRNFASATALQAFRRDGGHLVDFIVRARWKGFSLHDGNGKPFDLIQHLEGLPAGQGPFEVLVQACVPGTKERLPMRLVIQRKPDGAADATRQQLRRAAPRKQKRLDPRTLVAAGFMILATSLPADAYPACEILTAYRLRWQIELAFKRLKSLIHIDQLPTRTPAAGRSWLYSHLILALVSDSMTQDFLDSFP